MNFHATRQYRSLIIARGFYYANDSGIPDWKKQIARQNLQGQGILEPPVMESLVALGYRIAGGEKYWLPKILSILFWLVGGALLYMIAERISGRTTAFFATAFYLFNPFTLIASRSFQPDPLMVMLLLASLLVIFKYNDQPARTRLLAAAILSALAIFIKPVSIFVIYTVFIFLSVQRQGMRKTITNPGNWLYFLVTLLPTIGFYLVYGIFLSGNLQIQAQASFLPRLLLDLFFWKGWLGNINVVVGFPVLIVALLGSLTFPRGPSRALIFGLWFGYGLFCLVFDYHIASHDYYHLQLIPIVSLSIAPVFALTADRILEVYGGWISQITIGLTILAALGFSALSVRYQLSDASPEEIVQTAEEIGGLVAHSPNTVFLASDYGLSLEYHGELSGQPWPLVSDLEWEHLAGQSPQDAGRRFQETFASGKPDYFIVVDLWELGEQADLKEFLSGHFPVLAEADTYVIYDLKSNGSTAAGN